MSEHLLEVTDTNFDSDVLNAQRPVLVDFWAPWCGPCKAIGPIIEKLAATYAGTVDVGKCNVDENPGLPGRYGIKAIPTLLFFDKGKLVDQITGMVNPGRIEETLRKLQAGEDIAPPFQMN
jgi:thioredoxin 1